MRYLITGATGFVGPHLVRKLTAGGHFCRCLVRKTSAAKALSTLGAEIIRGDITVPESLPESFRGIDCVLHLATLGHMSNFTVTEEMFTRTNVRGTANVMQAALAAGVRKIVHCSTVAAMGICPERPATETSPCRPHHPYGRSKLAAEKTVLQMVRDRKLPAVIVRFSMIYGPGDRRDMLRLVRLARKGLFPRIGSRPKLTPLIHVDDAVDGLLQAARKGKIGEIYLLTNPRSEPFDDIRQIIQRTLNIKRFPIYVPERAALFLAAAAEKACLLMGKRPPVSRKNIESTLADRVFSIEKAQRELDFDPKTDPEGGLAATVDWYRRNGWI